MDNNTRYPEVRKALIKMLAVTKTNLPAAAQCVRDTPDEHLASMVRWCRGNLSAVADSFANPHMER